MGLENIKKNIDMYAARDHITVNGMYQLIDILMRDIRELNRVDSTEDMEVDRSHMDVLFDCMQGILEDAISILEKNAFLLDDEVWKIEIEELGRQTAEKNAHLERIGKDIKEQQEQKRQKDEELREMDEQMKAVQKSVSKAEEEIRSMKEAIVTMETAIANMETEKKEYASLRKKLSEGKANLLSYESKYAMLLTAFNSGIQDDARTANVFSEAEGGYLIEDTEEVKGIARKVESVWDLNKWMENMEQRIEALISVYRKELANLLEVENVAGKTEGGE